MGPELGALVTTHRGRPWRNLGGLLISGGLAGAAVWATGEMRPEKPAWGWAFAAGMAACALYFLVLAVDDIRTRVRVHERGVDYVRRRYGRRFAFAEIVDVSQLTVNGRAAQLFVTLRAGEVKLTTDVTESAAMIEAVVERTAARLPVATLRRS